MAMFGFGAIFGGKKEEPKPQTMKDMGFVREAVTPGPLPPDTRSAIQSQAETQKVASSARPIATPAPTQEYGLSLVPTEVSYDPSRIFGKDHQEHIAMIEQVERNAQAKDSPHATVKQNAPPRSPEEMLDAACLSNTTYETRVTAEHRRMAENARSNSVAQDIAQTREMSKGRAPGD